MTARAIKSYRTVSVDSAPPSRLLDDLLARLLRDCADARDAITAKDVAAKGRHLDHALAIVGELTAALDRDASPELADNLAALWGFVGAQITDASVRCAAEPLDEAERVIAVLRDAFAAASGLR